MTEIKFWECTYRGTAEGDHGVFTDKYGTVFAGQIADGFACVGVRTYTSGGTTFVECDADGLPHGRKLDCTADGDTVYRRYEHGSLKERADLLANGKCFYEKGECFPIFCKGKKCSADYPPFAALQAMVLPIKARHSRPMPAFAPRTPPANRCIGHCFCTRRSWQRRTPTRCAPAAADLSTVAAKQTHRASNRDDAPGGTVHYACNTNHMCSAPFRRPVPAVHAQWTPMCLHLSHHVPPAVFERCGLRRAATLGCSLHAPHGRRQCALPPRFAPRTCTPAPSHGPNSKARATRP
jgi:hypothetical protein